MLKSRPNVNFDPMFHIYTDRDSGDVIPSVTTILKRAGYVTSFYKGTDARDEGTEIHELTTMVDDTGMIPGGSSAKVDKCLEQYALFLLECKAKRVRSECLVHSKTYGYAGTLDGAWSIGIEPYNGAILLGDIKTGSTIPSWCKLQLAAYDVADGATILRPPMARFALHLTPDKYKIKMYDQLGDYPVWIETAKKFAGE